MNKEKILAISKRYKGSILAYSLIILAVMLGIATSLSVATIIEKKGASGTEFSVQSLQTADSGLQLALKKINNNRSTNIKDIPGYGGCDNGVVKSLSDAGKGEYELSFLAEDGETPANCDEPASEIANIKSVGTYNSTVRSVSVAVAATGAVVNSFFTATTVGMTEADCEDGCSEDKVIGPGYSFCALSKNKTKPFDNKYQDSYGHDLMRCEVTLDQTTGWHLYAEYNKGGDAANSRYQVNVTGASCGAICFKLN